ncbi:hypothetical protein KOR42_09750 [Thalassoglobus neptunius]|uniref:Uncharacterized protein n=1 Tax=Thalassoglobus neptunius TaxID=1938619 RepID=A0A5C5X5U1_9PLAN|nr:hypothetical protein [Thalassoglobus neptunius]TWT57613.1 hypothetical protein KOR42_09750 [Thalassoglobus neptunius]
MSRHLMTLKILSILALTQAVVLGNDPGNRPLVELWYLGDSAPSHPEVVVLGDGRLQIMSPEGPERSQLSQDQLQELIHGLVNLDGLKSVETSQLESQISLAEARSGLKAQIPHAGDTVIRLRIGEEYREIRCHAVGVLANRFPELECVRAVAAATRRLENLRAVTTVGGHEEAKYIADLATRQVEDFYDMKLAISVQDLSMVRALPDGSRFSQFVVESNAGGESMIRMVSVTETPGHHPRVSMIGGPTIR